ncbi:Detected protein of unknown function [Hibiscus syriacus]|uniref:Uncharacterized protein n=1 Tax=Hibiscus syriacus TaxID=106335 RepID=A0A6A3BF09_HIBSY|nr:Detected protein of unknown function [Hibiscus syriacus]
MATFTAIALDSLLEPGPSRSVEDSGPNLKPPIPKPKPITNSKMERSSNTSATRKVNRPQISPSLYATPEATAVPNSPTSFSPSPYIINHKRCGSCLSKSFSADNVSSQEKILEEVDINEKRKLADCKFVDQLKDGFVTYIIPEPNEDEHENGATHNCPIVIELENSVHGGSIQEEHMYDFHDGEFGSYNAEAESSQINNGLPMDVSMLKIGPFNLELFATPGVGFFDAWDEVSSGSAPQTIPHNVEAELREIRLSLLTEIEKSKQAEEALNKIQSKWQRIVQEFGDVGLVLPVDLLNVTEDELVNQDEELRQQVGTARFVSLSVGRGITRAEIEMKMEAQIESKNFEIARLLEHLHYYEAVNQEMSQRNHEAFWHDARDKRKKIRQQWVWGSVASTITLGTAALSWSYISTGKDSSSASIPKGPGDNPTAE